MLDFQEHFAYFIAENYAISLNSKTISFSAGLWEMTTSQQALKAHLSSLDSWVSWLNVFFF